MKLIMIEDDDDDHYNNDVNANDDNDNDNDDGDGNDDNIYGIPYKVSTLIVSATLTHTCKISLKIDEKKPKSVQKIF